MARRKKPDVVRGARSVVTEDQASFVDDESRRGKHFDGGRKVVELDHVGETTPDTDAERAKPREGAR